MSEAELRVGIMPQAFSAVDMASFNRGWSVDAYNDDPQHWGAGIWLDERCVAYIYVSDVVGESELLRIACLPEQRGRGLAAQLMQRYLAEVRVSQYFLEVSHVNAAAIRLYEGFGFRQVGQRKDYYAAGEHALLMQREGVV